MGKIIDGMEDLGTLPHGAHLYRERNPAGGWTYYSNECGCMSVIWDTCIANESTLLAAILCEQHRTHMDLMTHSGWKPSMDMQIEQMAATGGSFLAPLDNGSIGPGPDIQESGVMNIHPVSAESGTMPGCGGKFRD